MLAKFPDLSIVTGGSPLPLDMQAWLESVRVKIGDGAVTTGNRPTANLFVGMPAFDSTLGKPIWVKSLSPTVWVDGVGTTV